MGLNWAAVDGLETRLVQGVPHVLLVLLHQQHLDTVGFLAVVGQLVGEAPLNRNDRWSIHVLHHLLAHPFVPSAALAALLDQEGHTQESDDRHEYLTPSATRVAVVSAVTLLIDFFIIEFFIIKFLAVPRLSRLSRVARLNRHLASEYRMVSLITRHHSRHALAEDRVILLLAVSISVSFNRMIGSRKIMVILVFSSVSVLEFTLVMAASFVVMGFLVVFMSEYRMISISLWFGERLWVTLNIIMAIIPTEDRMVSARHHGRMGIDFHNVFL